MLTNMVRILYAMELIAAMRLMYCKMVTGHYYEIAPCVGWDYPSLDDLVLYRLFLGFYLPEWAHAIGS